MGVTSLSQNWKKNTGHYLPLWNQRPAAEAAIFFSGVAGQRSATPLGKLVPASTCAVKAATLFCRLARILPAIFTNGLMKVIPRSTCRHGSNAWSSNHRHVLRPQQIQTAPARRFPKAAETII